MYDFLILLVGLIIGVVICYLLLKASIERKYSAMFEKWKIEMEQLIRKDALDRARAVIKGKITEQFAPLLPMFKYETADARFIGSPIDYIVFEGYTEMKDGRAEELQNIVFIDVKTGKARLTKEERKIKEAVESKRVKWETITIKKVLEE